MAEPTPHKTALAVIYNHHFEGNIPLIRKMYGGRFSQLVQIMPFYYGSEQDVLPAYGNSFEFYSFIIQSKKVLSQLDCDYILFVGDDLVLNPVLNESNAASLLALNTPEDCYLDGFVDVSRPISYRATREAHMFSTSPQGLDKTANRILPTYEEAFSILHGKGVMESVELKQVKPFYPAWVKPYLSNLKQNYRILRARAWHFRNQFRYRYGNYKASYPVVFGFSDIIAIPRARLMEWCSILEIFATWRMFVELAVPTSLLLMNNTHVVTNDCLALKTGNVWFPQDPGHYAAVDAHIREMSEQSGFRIDQLHQYFPKEYLYLHPVKLSRFR